MSLLALLAAPATSPTPTRPGSLDGATTERLVSWSRVAHHKSTSPQTHGTPHPLAADAEGFRVALGNVAWNLVLPYGAGPNPVTYTGSITVRGTVHPLAWSGEPSVTVAPGAIAMSDPVDTWGAAGETMTVTIGATATGTVPTMEGYSDGTGIYLTGPLAVIASTPDATPQPRWLILGDSTIEGVGDNLGGRSGQYGTGGYVNRALDTAGHAYLNAAASGERWNQLDATTYTGRIGTLHAYADRALVGYCINDILVYTTAQTATNYLGRWKDLRTKGLAEVYQVTVLPRTGADGTTVAEGGLGSVERNAWNAWLRDGAPGYVFSGNGLWYHRATGDVQADTIRIGQTYGGNTHPLTGVLDVAAMAANPAAPNQWKTGYTLDGVHPSPAGHAAMAAEMVAWLATL